MARDVISEKILQKIMSNPKIRGMELSSVRNAISEIHVNNIGITMNAAASVFARKKGFSIYKSLRTEDKLSLQHLKTQVTEARENKSKSRKIKETYIKPDFKSQFVREANNNAKSYPYIYILENTLRNVIFEKFGSGEGWWNNKQIVGQPIQDYAKRIQEAERKYPWLKDRGNHSVYYVGLFELFKIIEKNWKPHFSDVFPDLELLRTWIKESVPIRHLVAHNVKTRPEERQNIKIKTDYICRLVEKWYAQRGSVKSSQ